MSLANWFGLSPRSRLPSLSCVLALALVPGEPFLDLAYAEALIRSKDEGKLLVVDFTASWCPPCKKMEKDTWPAESVRTWLAAHAVTIQVDVDEQQELSRTLKIAAMPTMIAFKDGAEFDRVVGYKDAEELLAWLDGVRAGTRAGDDVREKGQALLGSDDIDARYDVAKDLLRLHDFEAAAKHYVWLWQNTRDSTRYTGVRLSFMLSDIAELCEAYEPARDAFDAFLDVLDDKLRARGSFDMDDWMEWFALSEEFEDDARVLAYFDARRGADGKVEWPHPLGFLSDYVTNAFFEVLSRHGRCEDAGGVLPDLETGAKTKLMEARQIRMMGKILSSDHDMPDVARRMLQERLARYHVAALCTGQTETAAAIARMLIEEHDDADSRMALVEAGLEARRIGSEHAAWLDEAEALGGDVAALRVKLAAVAPEAEAPVPTPADGR